MTSAIKLYRNFILKLKRFCLSLVFHSSHYFPDKVYLDLLYYFYFGHRINWKNPMTFNEKLQWLKLYDRKPEYTMMVDKVMVKDYVSQLIGSEYVIPTLGVWNNPDDITFETLPSQFVIKCNHNSGGLIICKDKSTLNQKNAKKKLRKSLKENFFYVGREWPYKNIQKKVFVEKFMSDDSSNELNDYKFYCFGGKPELVMFSTGRYQGKLCFDYYDMHWNKLNLEWDQPNSSAEIPCPVCFSEMKDIATKLSQGIPHVRVDLYCINGRPYFGELTFFDASGFGHFSPSYWNLKLGNLIQLPQKN